MNMKSAMFLGFLVASVLGSAVAQNSGTTTQPKSTTTQAKVAYACPMHPDVTSEKAGTCAKCGMALVTQSAGTESAKAMKCTGGKSCPRAKNASAKKCEGKAEGCAGKACCTKEGEAGCCGKR